MPTPKRSVTVKSERPSLKKVRLFCSADHSANEYVQLNASGRIEFANLCRGLQNHFPTDAYTPYQHRAIPFDAFIWLDGDPRSVRFPTDRPLARARSIGCS